MFRVSFYSGLCVDKFYIQSKGGEVVFYCVADELHGVRKGGDVTARGIHPETRGIFAGVAKVATDSGYLLAVDCEVTAPGECKYSFKSGPVAHSKMGHP